MKQRLAFLFLPALLTFSSQLAFAQRSIPVGVGGFGSVIHPGGVPTGVHGVAPPPPPVYGYGTRGQRPSTRNGGYGNGGYGGYPIYVGGAYVPAYGSSYAPDYSGQTQFSPQQQSAPAPPVVINQYFAPPTSAPEPVTGGVYQPYTQRQQQPQPEDDQGSAAPTPTKYYLLAFKDHSVYSALAYWVEDKTLHYVTPQNSHNQASLDLVDVEFTKQMNQDKARPFSIETPSK